MDVEMVALGVCALSSGVLIMRKHKFWRYNTWQLQFIDGFNRFLLAALLAGIGIAAIVVEVKKLI
ncbi:hypothetical protein [Pedobacter sp. SYP-B3415]|uniref:hypothetical protein n=1 Tax=Pedobacter sp. SYP-B3415 TaxID=2496641 RepID=UPI00101C2421|nr:hypothetical protein [Pedobacter sp. SYP-B3415]